ncbi:MAG: alpha/beta fold hydrolase [Chloroflexi bacterium]|nr:alpha/beta fold hydrolase [Chloroflexota bacterium]
MTTPRPWLFLLLAAVAVTAGACARDAAPAPTAAPTIAAAPTPSLDYEVNLEGAPCSFDLPAGQDETNVRCGFVEVPEGRSDSSSRRIRLAFAVLRSTAQAPDTPLLVLDGGPGGSTLQGIFPGWFTADFAAPLQSARDLVFFDYRGTGLSEPDMSCPELDALSASGHYGTGSPSEEDEREAEEALFICRDRIVANGAQLNAYNSAAIAADAADVMKALGYDDYSVYGVSYGTRVALTMLRDGAAGIRSIVLDSAYPPQVDLYAGTALNQQQALERVFAACEAQPPCAEAYPQLEETLLAAVQQVDEEPVTLEARDARSGALRPIEVNGPVLLSVLFGSISTSRFLERIPQLIDAAANGQYAGLTPLLDAQYGGAGGPTGAVPMRTSVLCSEEMPFAEAGAVLAASAQLWPELREAKTFGITDEETLREEKEFCSRWGAAPRPDVETRAVAGDTPALILAGEFDPSTPPEWGRIAGSTLAGSVFVEVQGLGHGLLFQRESDCPMQIIAAFLEDPATADISCARAGVPAFTLPRSDDP